MAFADALVAETDATVAIVDRYGRPGGHWTLAYPFVRLHQPSSFYGVNSRALGTGEVDQHGWNAGLHELASADEILTYFDQVMRKTLLHAGLVSARVHLDYRSKVLRIAVEDEVAGARHTSSGSGSGPATTAADEAQGTGTGTGTGHGMIGMHEPGGTFTAGPRPAGGFRINTELPLRADRKG
ncbi:cation diffusion facilitator CzcD-associated flavoprotein CzcO [Kitasatospora kifunensis]|uniref:Cation diffusion facilitator CzcD-associated flavoprotein CzcO n=2 Tax=Kitasatospora kifunensis TaxID=58351 RepID=A0A7W7R9X0_KITKI|nr:cation diffusion facilitator CzcD-associated flavoprotein CzcO [Kitasatospora kifunensis]